MNPPIQAATVGSREIWEEKRVALVSAAVNPASQRCEGGLTSLAGRYNSNQLSPAGYASQCRFRTVTSDWSPQTSRPDLQREVLLFGSWKYV